VVFFCGNFLSGIFEKGQYQWISKIEKAEKEKTAWQYQAD
jgi:hypothetical protein